MNFWYLPKGAEDDELNQDAGTIEELEQNGKIAEDQEKDVGEENKIQKGLINETNVPYSAGELIGLSRDIEGMVGEALGDPSKVKTL